ncbi:ubiquinol-cytochrome c reductase complex assembly factor 1-like [Discoglossus pictus]
MAALVRLGTRQIRLNSQIASLSLLHPNTCAQTRCGRTLYNSNHNLCNSASISRDIRYGPSHRSHTATQTWRALHVSHNHYSAKHEPQPTEEEVGAFTKIIEAMGFTGPLKYNKWKIKIAALRMYTCCVERIDYDEFFEKCNLPDTLNSWFLVTQLHVWMCLVRMKQEGRSGKYMCRYIVHSMWEDVQQRGKVMGVSLIGSIT